MKKTLILELKGNSLDDGPGIRSVVFFKGCPLSCIWCHNPESKKTGVEISFEPNECVGCNTCLGTCTKNALSKENPFFIDRTLCNLCFECVTNCPSNALERVGHEMNVPEIVETVLKDKPFFDTSKGGVTFSGGEPTLDMDFLGKTAKALKENGVHVLIETCGQFNYEKFNELVYPHVDLIYFDIKIMDSSHHKKYCGLPNKTILENFRTLYRRYLDGGTEVLPRTPLIPDITDTKENLLAIVSLYKEEQVKKTQLMAYHPLWRDKNLKLGISLPSTSEGKMGEWMATERTKACEKIFTDAGIALEP
ncbi:MAG: glycyl-radical enzyme activating protein [Desulfobacterium sp.]|nr:glycyl-radical enzyme activating protein [Desulfobacterium sp.]